MSDELERRIRDAVDAHGRTVRPDEDGSLEGIRRRAADVRRRRIMGGAALGAAAALVIGIAVGVAVGRGDDGTTPVAAGGPSTTTTPCPPGSIPPGSIPPGSLPAVTTTMAPSATATTEPPLATTTTVAGQGSTTITESATRDDGVTSAGGTGTTASPTAIEATATTMTGADPAGCLPPCDEVVDGYADTLPAATTTIAVRAPGTTEAPGSTTLPPISRPTPQWQLCRADPSTTTTTGPTTTAPTSPEDQAAIDDITHAFIVAFDATASAEERAAVVEDGPAVVAAGDEASAKYPQARASVRATVHSVRLDGADRASVVFELSYQGAALLGPQHGEALRIDGTWKVSADTRCALIRQAGVACP